MPPDEIKPTSIRLPAELRERLAQLAEADGRSMSNYIIRVLEQHAAAIGKRPGARSIGKRPER